VTAFQVPGGSCQNARNSEKRQQQLRAGCVNAARPLISLPVAGLPDVGKTGWFRESSGLEEREPNRTGPGCGLSAGSIRGEMKRPTMSVDVA